MWQGYPSEVCDGKNSRKGRELPTALAALGARWTGLWGQWPVLLRRGSTALCPYAVSWPWLADAYPAALASSHRGHPCCQHLDTDTHYTTFGGHVCCWISHAISNPCSCTSHCPVAGDKDQLLISAGLDSFLLNRAGPQEILAGFCTCLRLFTLLNKVRNLSGAFQFCVLLISQFSLITGVLVKTCLLGKLFQPEY